MLVFVTIDISSDAALPEEQTVLGQRPSFVTQQVAHLSKLFIQRGVPGLALFASFL